MISCWEQIGLGLERECRWGRWNDGGCWLSKGRNQTPRIISNILFKMFRAGSFFVFTLANLTCLKLLTYIHECTSSVFISGELEFVCVVYKVEDFGLSLPRCCFLLLYKLDHDPCILQTRWPHRFFNIARLFT